MNKLIRAICRLLCLDNSKDWEKTFIQFVEFGLVGALNTLISWGCYYFFLWIDDSLYLLGCFVGGVVSIANAFFWNDKYVFKGTQTGWRDKCRRLVKTYVSYSGTAILSIILVWVEVNWFGVSKTIAPIVTLLITIPLNFIINKFWTFGTGGKR